VSKGKRQKNHDTCHVAHSALNLMGNSIFIKISTVQILARIGSNDMSDPEGDLVAACDAATEHV
jgi:hypothetical protein